MLTPDISNLFKDVMQHIAPAPVTPPSIESESYPGAWSYNEKKQVLVQLEAEWKGIIDETQTNRDDRYLDVDVKGMRSNGQLLPDEIISCRRVVDNNITREKSPYINFLTQPRRSLVLHCQTDPDVKPAPLELSYTRLSRYQYWTRPWFQMIDGAQLNGWASMLTLFDPSMPGHFKRKYIARDRLMFPRRTVDIRKVEYLVFIIDVTKSQLKKWVKQYGFAQDQVDMVVNKDIWGSGSTDVNGDREEVFCLRMCYYISEDGTIFVCWYHTDCSDWLKPPQPLYMGIQEMQAQPMDSGLGALNVMMDGSNQQPTLVPVYETEYPVDVFVYREDDSEVIIEHRGRAFLDKYVQIAQTCIWSSFINKLVRSSNTYGSPKAVDNTNPGVPKIEKAVKLVNGAFYSSAVEFWSFPPPGLEAIAASQALSSENATDTQQTAFQVINRKDSRKTKEELKQADEQQQQAVSVPISLFSDVVTSIESRGFKIVHNRAKVGALKDFIPMKPAIRYANPANYQQEQLERQYLLDQSYECRASGDIDYIEREAKVAKMKQYYPLLAQTGLGLEFMADLLISDFPDDGQRWAKILKDSAAQPGVIKALVTAMQGVLKEYGATMKPQEIAGINQVLQQAMQSLGLDSQPKQPTMQS